MLKKKIILLFLNQYPFSEFFVYLFLNHEIQMYVKFITITESFENLSFIILLEIKYKGLILKF